MFKLSTAARITAYGIVALAGSSTVTYASDEVERVVINATRIQQQQAKLPYRTEQVSKDSIEQQQAQHIEQLLNKIPGVQLARGSGQEYLPSLRSPVMNGSGACGRVLTAIDGVALRASGFCNVNELFESPFEFAGGIEVLKGPVSSLYGSNAVTGVINIVTPEFEASPFNKVSLEGGENEYVRAKVHSQFGNEDNGVQIAAVATHDGGFRDDSGLDQQKAMVKFRNDNDGIVTEHQFYLTNLEQETAGYLVGSDSYKDKDSITQNANPEAFRNANSFRYQGKWQGEDADSQWQIAPYFRHTSMEFLQHFLPGDPLEENGHDSAGLQTIYRTPWSNYDLTFGVDAEYSQGYLKQGSELGLVFAGVPTGKHYDYEVSAFSVAPFMVLSGQYQAVNWQFGLRAEWLSYDYDNKMLNGVTDQFGQLCNDKACRFSRPDDRSDDFVNFAPKFGLSFPIGDSAKAFANWSLGYRAPTHFELYRLQRQQELANIDSERANSFEVGVERHTNKLDYQVSLYTMTLDNVIFTDPKGFNVDNGETSHKGIEALVNYRFSEQWQLQANATYAVHKYEDIDLLSDDDVNGQDMDSAPRWLANTQLSYNQENWQVQLTGQYQDEYYTDPLGDFDYPGHTLLHLSAQWQLSSNSEISMRVHNLLDERYADRADYSGFAGERYFPGMPRTIYLQWQYKW